MLKEFAPADLPEKSCPRIPRHTVFSSTLQHLVQVALVIIAPGVYVVHGHKKNSPVFLITSRIFVDLAKFTPSCTSNTVLALTT